MWDECGLSIFRASLYLVSLLGVQEILNPKMNRTTMTCMPHQVILLGELDVMLMSNSVLCFMEFLGMEGIDTHAEPESIYRLEMSGKGEAFVRFIRTPLRRACRCLYASTCV